MSTPKSTPAAAALQPHQRSAYWRTVGCAAAACAAVTVAGYLFGVHPALSALAERHVQESELSDQRAKADDAAARLADARRRLDVARREVAALPLRLEPASAINRRLNRLAESAQRAGVAVHELQPGAAVDGPHYQTVPIRLAGAGPYPACAAFLHALRTEFPDVTIRSFEATNPSVSKDGPNAAAFRIELAWHTTPATKR